MPDQPHHPLDDASVDALARQAGAELRVPAPDGFADGVRRTRRRQQTVRAGLGGAGLAVIIAIGVVTLTGGEADHSVVPATDPTTVTSAASPTTDPTTETPTSNPDVAGPTIPPIGTDADGIPDGVYAPADDGVTAQDVFDPITLERRDTIPASLIPVEPISGGVSASGAVTYTAPGADAPLDACNQTPATAWVAGADASGLPDWVTQIVVSTDGRVGAAITVDCASTNGTAPDGGRAGSYEVSVVVFDPDAPNTLTAVLAVDGADEAPSSLALSDDGSYLLVTTTPRPFAEGIASQIRVIDTATGEVVAAIGNEQSGDLPRTDCGLGFVSMDFVSSTAIAYTAICSDGLAVVIRDLAGGETLEVLQPEYAGRTYETMTAASMQVDRATFTTPSTTWFILCAERATPQGDGSVVFDAPGSHPCWLGHGDEVMREIPTATTIGARFDPFG